MIIMDTYEYIPANFTCYMHLQCNRGPLSTCLDWSEICNEQVDCLDGEFDEENCWQMEINQCNDDEFRCTNGQCIPQSFYRDDSNTADCIDGSDEITSRPYKNINSCNRGIPSIGCEEHTCKHTFLTSSCQEERSRIMWMAVYSTKDDSISEECWSALNVS